MKKVLAFLIALVCAGMSYVGLHTVRLHAKLDLIFQAILDMINDNATSIAMSDAYKALLSIAIIVSFIVPLVGMIIVWIRREDIITRVLVTCAFPVVLFSMPFIAAGIQTFVAYYDALSKKIDGYFVLLSTLGLISGSLYMRFAYLLWYNPVSQYLLWTLLSLLLVQLILIIVTMFRSMLSSLLLLPQFALMGFCTMLIV